MLAKYSKWRLVYECKTEEKLAKNISLHFAYRTCKDLPYLSYETDKVGQKVVSKWPHEICVIY